jgi:hypothetical protein
MAEEGGARMTSLWWWALPVLLLPILWHRQKREQTKTAPLASARFLPSAQPKQLRVWRWSDPLLLLLRCLLLVTLIALLADLVLPWRGDAILVVPGTDPALVEKQAAGFKEAQRMTLPGRDAVNWLHAHEREFKPEARLVVVGDIAMPATLPRFRHRIELRPQPAAPAGIERHVAVFSRRQEDWRRLFAAPGALQRYVIDAHPGATNGKSAELIVWDLPEAPPATLRAPLWWVGDARVFPELAKAVQAGTIRYADSARGRLWSMEAWPLSDADGARALLASWQRLQYPPQPFTAPPQVLAGEAGAPAGPASGALREMLSLALLVLFALERILTHVRRR